LAPGNPDQFLDCLGYPALVRRALAPGNPDQFLDCLGYPVAPKPVVGAVYQAPVLAYRKYCRHTFCHTNFRGRALCPPAQAVRMLALCLQALVALLKNLLKNLDQGLDYPAPV
jgi:hypothetical protein